MAASFVVGYNKVITAKEPRFLVLSGDEYRLKERVLDVIISRGTVNSYIYLDCASSATASQTVFTQSTFKGREHTYILRNADQLSSWEWLPVWFNKAKNLRIVVSDAQHGLCGTLIARANTRGYSIDCSAPSGENARAKFVKLLGLWYGQSLTQINLLLNKQNWRIDESLELLEKLKILQQPLTSEIINTVGVVVDPRVDFLEALKNDNTTKAIIASSNLSTKYYMEIVLNLSDWLNRMIRVKSSQGYMRSANDIAFETGETHSDVEILQKQARRFDFTRANKIALALASADKELTRGNYSGVLEILVARW